MVGAPAAEGNRGVRISPLWWAIVVSIMHPLWRIVMVKRLNIKVSKVLHIYLSSRHKFWYVLPYVQIFLRCKVLENWNAPNDLKTLMNEQLMPMP